MGRPQKVSWESFDDTVLFLPSASTFKCISVTIKYVRRWSDEVQTNETRNVAVISFRGNVFLMGPSLIVLVFGLVPPHLCLL